MIQFESCGVEFGLGKPALVALTSNVRCYPCITKRWVLAIADTLLLFPILRYGYFEEIRNDQNYFTPSSKLLWEMQMSIHPPHAIVNEENKTEDSNNSSNYRVIPNAAFPFCFYSSDSEALGKIKLGN